VDALEFRNFSDVIFPQYICHRSTHTEIVLECWTLPDLQKTVGTSIRGNHIPFQEPPMINRSFLDSNKCPHLGLAFTL